MTRAESVAIRDHGLGGDALDVHADALGPAGPHQGALAAAVPSRIRRYETQSEPVPLWDNRSVLIALALLLTLEWAFRKTFKLL